MCSILPPCCLSSLLLVAVASLLNIAQGWRVVLVMLGEACMVLLAAAASAAYHMHAQITSGRLGPMSFLLFVSNNAEQSNDIAMLASTHCSNTLTQHAFQHNTIVCIHL